MEIARKEPGCFVCTRGTKAFSGAALWLRTLSTVSMTVEGPLKGFPTSHPPWGEEPRVRWPLAVPAVLFRGKGAVTSFWAAFPLYYVFSLSPWRRRLLSGRGEWVFWLSNRMLPFPPSRSELHLLLPRTVNQTDRSSFSMGTGLMSQPRACVQSAPSYRVYWGDDGWIFIY